MTVAVTKGLHRDILRKADLLIAKYQLHSGDPCQPVVVDALVECYTRNYWDFQDKVEAVTLHFWDKRKRYTDIVYSAELFDLSASARKRHATVHEFAHIFLKHDGELFIMGRLLNECHGLDWYVATGQEVECERLSAYILVQLRSLLQMHGMGAEYVARQLDVPSHLVELRYEVWRKFGK